MKLSGKEKEIHKGVLRDLMKEMEDVMHGDISPRAMKKVTVMAKDKAGLKEGLEKAEEVMDEMPEASEKEEESEELCPDCGKNPCECEDAESESEEAPHEEASDLDSLRAKIKELEAKLAEKQ